MSKARAGWAFLALALALSGDGGLSQPAAPTASRGPSLSARIHVQPDDVAVFAGSALNFHAHVIGAAAAPAAVRWRVFGAGAIDDDGLFRAPATPGGSSSIVATIGLLAGGARVAIAAPPPPAAVHAIVACYGDGALDVRATGAEPSFGQLRTGTAAADVAVASTTASAIVAVDDRLVSIDLATMTPHLSPPVRGARFSEIGLLGGGAYAVATDANADETGPGIDVYRLQQGEAPSIVSRTQAGETPEGIAVADDGVTFFVSSVNGNAVRRFVLDSSGIARKTGSVRTGTRPFGVALDSRRRLLFVADNDTPTLSGSASRPGLEVFALPSLRRVGAPRATGSANALPLGVAVDAAAGRLFVTNEGDDDVAVYALPSLRREATLSVGRTPWLPSVDVRHHVLYVPDARDDAFDVFDTRTLAHTAARVPTCSYPVAVGVAE